MQPGSQGSWIPTYEPCVELAVLLAIAVFAGAVAVRLRQPVLIASTVVGIAAGPAGFALMRAAKDGP